MIIGNNNNMNNNPLGNQKSNIGSSPFNSDNTFNNRFNTVKEEAKKNHDVIKPFPENNHMKKYYDVNNQHDMYEKSFSMLQDRLNNGLISIDEFNRKCNQLNKLRQK